MSDNQADADVNAAPESGSQSGSSSGSDPTPPLGTTDLLAEIATSSLIDSMGIKITHATPELLVATMPVAGNTQPYGLLHGGASCVLAESLGSVGAALHAARSGKIAVGIDINATHHRGVRDGLVTGTARSIQLGGSLASYEIVIEDEQGRRVCTARLTCMLRSAPASG